MSYCTQSDIEVRIGPADLVALADHDGDGAADSAVVQGAISSAQALIDSYLSVRYAVPVAPVPDALKTRAVSLSVYFLRLGRDCVTDDVRAPVPRRRGLAGARRGRAGRPRRRAAPGRLRRRARRALPEPAAPLRPRRAPLTREVPTMSNFLTDGRLALLAALRADAAISALVRTWFEFGPGLIRRHDVEPALCPVLGVAPAEGAAVRGSQRRARGAPGAARRGGHGRPGRRALRGAGRPGARLRGRREHGQPGPRRRRDLPPCACAPSAGPRSRARTPPGRSGPPPSRSNCSGAACSERTRHDHQPPHRPPSPPAHLPRGRLGPLPRRARVAVRAHPRRRPQDRAGAPGLFSPDTLFGGWRRALLLARAAQVRGTLAALGLAAGRRPAARHGLGAHGRRAGQLLPGCLHARRLAAAARRDGADAGDCGISRCGRRGAAARPVRARRGGRSAG